MPLNVSGAPVTNRAEFFETMRRNLFSTRSDVTFVIDGREFQLHKAVLAASCPYFETMLFGHTNEASMKTITLKDTPKKLFEIVIQYIYTGQLDSSGLTAQEFVNLICLAHEYQFDDLLSTALSIATFLIDKKSSMDFVAFLLNFTFTHEHDGAQEKCLDVFDSVADEIITNVDVFSMLCPEAVCAIISRDSFVAQEIAIFKALKTWIEINGSSDLNDVVLLELRLSLISVTDFNRFVKPTNLIEEYVYSLALRDKESRERTAARLCWTHNTTCSSEISKCWIRNSNGSARHIKGPNFDNEIVNFSCGETFVIEFRVVTCKVNLVRLKALSASCNRAKFRLKLFHGTKSKMVPITSGDGRILNASFKPQRVDKLELAFDRNYFYNEVLLKFKIFSFVCMATPCNFKNCV